MNPNKLPSEIKVKISQEKNGVIFAELKDYGIFTEANNFNELILNINDLIYSFLGIPQKDRYKFWYLPLAEKVMQREKLEINPLVFHILTRPDINQYKNVN